MTMLSSMFCILFIGLVRVGVLIESLGILSVVSNVFEECLEFLKGDWIDNCFIDLGLDNLILPNVFVGLIGDFGF